MAVTVRSTETERIEVREDLIRIIDSGNCGKELRATRLSVFVFGFQVGMQDFV